MMIRVPGALRVLALPILGSQGRRLGSLLGSYVFHPTAGPFGNALLAMKGTGPFGLSHPSTSP